MEHQSIDLGVELDSAAEFGSGGDSLLDETVTPDSTDPGPVEPFSEDSGHAQPPTTESESAPTNEQATMVSASSSPVRETSAPSPGSEMPVLTPLSPERPTVAPADSTPDVFIVRTVSSPPDRLMWDNADGESDELRVTIDEPVRTEVRNEFLAQARNEGKRLLLNGRLISTTETHDRIESLIFGMMAKLASKGDDLHKKAFRNSSELAEILNTASMLFHSSSKYNDAASKLVKEKSAKFQRRSGNFKTGKTAPAPKSDRAAALPTKRGARSSSAEKPAFKRPKPMSQPPKFIPQSMKGEPEKKAPEGRKPSWMDDAPDRDTPSTSAFPAPTPLTKKSSSTMTSTSSAPIPASSWNGSAGTFLPGDDKLPYRAAPLFPVGSKGWTPTERLLVESGPLRALPASQGIVEVIDMAVQVHPADLDSEVSRRELWEAYNRERERKQLQTRHDHTRLEADRRREFNRGRPRRGGLNMRGRY